MRLFPIKDILVVENDVEVVAVGVTNFVEPSALHKPLFLVECCGALIVRCDYSKKIPNAKFLRMLN